MDSGDWVMAAVVGAGVVWWLARGDVDNWRRGLTDPGLTGLLLLELAVGLLLWVWVAQDDDVPGLVVLFAGLAALVAAIIVLVALRIMIVALVRRFRGR